MSHATEVAKSGDDMIRFLGQRESGICDYAIGNKITVSFRGSRYGHPHFCHTCRVVDGDGQPGCEHTRRIERYRVENFA